jgi:phosphopantetheine--protein transferase-like protein
MSKTEELKAMVATMLMVSPGDIGPKTSLKPLDTSLGSAKVRLGLKRLGLALPAESPPTNFGALVAAVSGEAAPAVAPVPSALPPNLPDRGNVRVGGLLVGLQVGLDVEDIRALPVALDYWEHEFYRATFTRSEIAYAVLQAEPRAHFAGFWCAKEALRKCDPAFSAVSMERTAVAHDASGRPYLTIETEVGAERLGHALSISHSAEVATAVVVLAPLSAAAPVAVPEPRSAPGVKKPRGLAKLFLGA